MPNFNDITVSVSVTLGARRKMLLATCDESGGDHVYPNIIDPLGGTQLDTFVWE
jgi:hypothetical protein